jgi:hypothetical protein
MSINTNGNCCAHMVGGCNRITVEWVFSVVVGGESQMSMAKQMVLATMAEDKFSGT